MEHVRGGCLERAHRGTARLSIMRCLRPLSESEADEAVSGCMMRAAIELQDQPRGTRWPCNSAACMSCDAEWNASMQIGMMWDAFVASKLGRAICIGARNDVVS